MKNKVMQKNESFSSNLITTIYDLYWLKKTPKTYILIQQTKKCKVVRSEVAPGNSSVCLVLNNHYVTVCVYSSDTSIHTHEVLTFKSQDWI